MNKDELLKAFEQYLNIDEEFTNPYYGTIDDDGFLDFHTKEDGVCFSLKIDSLVGEINDVLRRRKPPIKKPITKK